MSLRFVLRNSSLLFVVNIKVVMFDVRQCRRLLWTELRTFKDVHWCRYRAYPMLYYQQFKALVVKNLSVCANLLEVKCTVLYCEHVSVFYQMFVYTNLFQFDCETRIFCLCKHAQTVKEITLNRFLFAYNYSKVQNVPLMCHASKWITPRTLQPVISITRSWCK